MEQTQPLILIVDDDSGIRSLCGSVLQPFYRVTTADDGQQALRVLFQEKPDLVLLDVSMPNMDGWETCRRVRELTDIPLIMLTARGGDHDVARALDIGADDYITKPFSPIAFLARIRAHLRSAARRREAGAGDSGTEVMSFDNGQLQVDRSRRSASVHGHEVALTATEYKLLECLARNAGRVLSHDQILEQVWGEQYRGESGYVKTYIGLLRQKVEPDPRNPQYIMARRGIGYYLERRVSERAIAVE